MKKVYIDVQDKKTFNNYHLRGFINIPYDNLVNSHRYYLNKNDIYYLFCPNGKLSKRASTILNYFGYKTYVVDK